MKLSMKQKNKKSLETLSLACQFCGLLVIFLGIMIVLFILTDQGVGFIQIGLFITIVGYAFVKISARISEILNSEDEHPSF